MHYIIGTQITVGGSTNRVPIRPGMSSQQIKKLSPKPTTFNDQLSQFTKGETYSITRIYTRDEKVCYKFTSLAGDTVEVLFNNVSSADKFIGELRSEQVPNYEQINRDKTD